MSNWEPADSPNKPVPMTRVLLACRHALATRPFVTIAKWADEHVESAGSTYYEGDDIIYDDVTDTYWWPTGWYEAFEFAGDEVWRIPDENVLAWKAMPVYP